MATAAPVSIVQRSGGRNIMIKNNNPLNFPSFRPLHPEMVHFCDFAHDRHRGGAAFRLGQRDVYARFCRSAARRLRGARRGIP
jgi:hypothetical protein